MIAVVVAGMVLVSAAFPVSASTGTAVIDDRPVPAAAPASEPAASAISAGWRHTCAIKHDDAIACWGDDAGGITTPPPGAFLALDAGNLHTCAIRTDHTVACWGYNDDGQSTAPPGTFATVSAGGQHSCGIGTDGTLLCWGAATPVQGSPTGTFTAVSAGNGHSCAIRTNGTMACWGSDSFGEATAQSGTWLAVVAGSGYSCGIKSAGTLDCWGRSDQGYLDVPAGTYTALNAALWHTCAIRADGAAACWGDSQFGKTTEPVGTFTSVTAGGNHSCGIRTNGWPTCWGGDLSGEAILPLGLHPVVSAGWYHSCALQPDGIIACWGDADGGTTTVPTGTYKTVSAGQGFSCAIRTNDTLACWGFGDDGRTAAPAGTFTSVSAGGNHACAVKTDGAIACWGRNDYGQSDPPSGAYQAVSAGFRTTCALRAGDGWLECWGSDEDGLATPDLFYAHTVSVGAFHACATRDYDQGVTCWGSYADGQTGAPTGRFSEVGAGAFHSCGLRIEGTLACWGYDGDGQASEPAGTYLAVSAGAWHSCAIALDGAPVCWGWNYYNQATTSEPAATTYVPVTPTRLLDSRSGNGLSGNFKANLARTFQVAGRGPVPANAVAVAGNFTVTRQTAKGYGSLTPVATSTPSTSTINFPVGDTRANNVTVALGPGGKLGAVYKAASGKTTDFLFDVTGYFLAADSAATYEPTSPVRLLDTRSGNGLTGRFVTGAPRTWQIAGRGGIPAGATAITGNVTVVGQTTAGYVSLGPVASASPTTSTINFPSGDTRANGFTAKLAGDGKMAAVFIGGSGAATHLIVDVTGYYVEGLSGSRFYPLPPDRVLDSRFEVGLVGAFKANTGRTLITAPRVGVPADAVAVTGNLTVVGQSKAGYISMTKATTNSPATSTLNFPVGDTRANGVSGPLTPAGTVGLVYRATAGGTTNLILDISGYYRSSSDVASAAVAGAPHDSTPRRDPGGDAD